jgi:hypothetical protein
MKKITTYFPLVAALILSRVLPHPANFTPLAAAAIFSGATLKRREMAILILGSMLVSDMWLGFDSFPSRMAVYGSLLLIGLLGRKLLANKTWRMTVVTSLVSSILFFLITNFEVWWWSGMYAHTTAGLTSCYFMALPFLRYTILGDMFFSGVFMAGWRLVKANNLGFEV